MVAQLGGNPGFLTVGQPAEKSYTSQSLLKISWPLAVGCLESPKALPSPGPLRFSAVERERDGAGRVQTALAGSSSCLQVHLCHANVSLAPYLNISVTSPLASATRTGKPMQAGTR